MYALTVQQRWFLRRQLFSKHVPADVQSWLFDPASLTARLKQKCRADFRVEVLSQRIQRPRLDELRVLGMETGSYALVRQVRLCCGSACWVYARTVIPFSTLKGKQRKYANLGTRPLGAMLFADRTMERDEVMVTSLTGKQLPDGLGLAEQDSVWGRRSVFRVGGRALLVSEYFLPALLDS
ncbi:MAG: chorismate lyase [Thiotrichales bacterium]|nr:MAG: chorismate lyase [Thiotrichales bacterium]